MSGASAIGVAAGRSMSTGTSSTSVMRWPEAIARCITEVLHGERADRVEEALDVEEERHHHADVELAPEHQRAADDDDHGHGDAGQRVDDRHHDLRVARRGQVRARLARALSS